MLRVHHLIRKLPRFHRYQVTQRGRPILNAILLAHQITIETASARCLGSRKSSRQENTPGMVNTYRPYQGALRRQTLLNISTQRHARPELHIVEQADVQWTLPGRKHFIQMTK